MERWALVSGLRGDLNLYEHLQNDLKKKRGVEHLFVLGDLVSPDHCCDALLNRLRFPLRNDLEPHCIYGWWEEQLLAEQGYRGDRKADDLRQSHGDHVVHALVEAVDADHLNWLSSLQFGFIELDCALIHGSSADVNDSITAESSPLLLLDRLTRLDVNRLFTARSGKQFKIELTGGGIDSNVMDLRGKQQQQHIVPKRCVVGIGSGSHYTLYSPGSDHIEFVELNIESPERGVGFG